MYHFERISVTPLLKDFIQGFWVLECTIPSQVPLWIVPDGYPEIVFNLKNRFQLLGKKGTSSSPQFGLIGQLTRTFELKAPQNSQAIFVKLYPWTAFRLFKMPMHLFIDDSPDLLDLEYGSEYIRLGKRVSSCEHILEAKKILEDFFLENIDLNTPVSPILKFAVIEIFRSNGLIKMDDLCKRVRVSRRYLEMLFKEQIGLSPTRYARMIKIKKISQQFFQKPPKSLSVFSQNWGFFDQSHFIREFKNNVQKTPKQFLKYAPHFPLMEKEHYLNQWDYS